MVQNDHQLMEFGSDDSSVLSRNTSTRESPMLISNSNYHVIYRLVLTGGPCSGKTTGQTRLKTFFENLGWKVFCVPEIAATLLSGGVRFANLSKDDSEKFQENLIKLMMSTERTYFTLSHTCKRNCLIICDRGLMDATAYMSKQKWQSMLEVHNWNMVELRDNRYNHVIHLVTAADGAEQFYENSPIRTEGIELAREMDKLTMQAWNGHPCFDIIDNSTDFNTKMRKMISLVCRRLNINVGDRLKMDNTHTEMLHGTKASK